MKSKNSINFIVNIDKDGIHKQISKAHTGLKFKIAMLLFEMGARLLKQDIEVPYTVRQLGTPVDSSETASKSYVDGNSGK